MRVGLAIGASVFAMMANPVLAQEVSAAQESLAAEDAPIVVTAQRREQNVQDVPIAISVVSGDALQEQRVRTIDQIGQQVSNTQIYQDKGGSQPNWTIRGVSLFDFNVNNSPSTSIFIDEVYQPSSVMGSGGIFDLERVEVLRGPQSGLYGRNSVGGAVQIISREARPGDNDGYVNLDYGSWHRYRLEAAQSVSLGDNTAVRLAVLNDGSFGGGWQDSVTGGRDWGEPDRLAVRGILRSEVGALTARLKLYYARDKSDTVLATASGAYSPTFDFCDAVLAGNLDQANCLTLAQLIDPTLDGAGAQSDDGTRVLSQPINQLDNEELSATLNLSVDLGAVTITSITGYTDFDFGFDFDYDASQLNLGGWTEQAGLRNFNQELRIASPSSGDFRWQAGILYTNYRFNEFKEFNWTDNPLLFDTFNPIFGLDYQDLFLDVTYRQKTRYWGVYGQFDYDITPDLTFSASLRYSDEKTTYREGRIGFQSITSFPAPGGIDLIPVGAMDRDYSLGDHWTGSATLSYRPTDDSMLYATISRGYKSGGVPGGFPQTTEDTIPYDEEFVLNFEGGFRTEWLDRALQVNGSIFYYDHDDIQAFTTLPSTLTPGQFAFRLTNIGSGYNFGGELEVVARPVWGLRLGASIGYLETKITDSDKVFFSFDNQAIPWKGQRLDYAPTWSGNLFVSYTADVSETSNLTVAGDYNFRSRLRYAQTAVDEALRGVAGYGVANGRITLEDDAGWSVSLWTKNLFDKAYVSDASNDGVGSYYRTFGEPRSVGVAMGFRW
ncbi:TonB-dependent receptor [Altererythrobacter sp.]|uniref:TonB-dependent receptor n=1 Tax=Altererythrobacter sp. TaxID=1872480 RepID=UPI003CFE8BFA